MKRFLFSLLAFALLGNPILGSSVFSIAQSTHNQATEGLALLVIQSALDELNLLTGENLTAKDWLSKYHAGSLPIEKLPTGEYALRPGGGLVIITTINPA